ncbi:CDP-2,3-bis-(O-geranylgeranyl)-sn-glycerol synthase [Methanopyrus sp. KOL6]|uniref:CDP-2,3-bis-(O-geranylgeranyl)-sn-glycerol synthase n=1 Tax=Methanopyrus sp. KOL6 TaxID=1937004 RepID=UPI000B4B26B2|nr:CDP-2,3-bis-(O-geranylgeranyl)-sn-glycerol synthase [Methanopyrus sp. KOL6]
MGSGAWLELGKGLWFILPAYIANLSACLFGGGRPLDFGKKLSDGRRLLGGGVTIRGFIVGVLAGAVVGLGEGFVVGDPWKAGDGFILGLGAMVGDAVGSFVKRRIGLERGAPAPVLDQLDFFAGAVLLYYLLYGWHPPGWVLVSLAILTLALHWLTNVIGYLLKLKEVPW